MICVRSTPLPLVSHIESPKEQLGPFFQQEGRWLAGTLKSCVLEAAVLQIKACLARALYKTFFGSGWCAVNKK